MATSRDYENTRQVAEAIYGHSSISLPYDLILIGYQLYPASTITSSGVVMAEGCDRGKLNHMQLGRYAEYFVRMEFTRHDFDVYTAEVDDKGIDFIVREDHRPGGTEVEVSVL